MALFSIVGVPIVRLGDAPQRMAEDGFGDFVLHAKARQQASYDDRRKSCNRQSVTPAAWSSFRLGRLSESGLRAKTNGDPASLGCAWMTSRAACGNGKRPALCFSRSTIGICQTPLLSMSAQRSCSTLLRRCAVSNSTLTKAPNPPASPAASHTFCSSLSDRIRERENCCLGVRRMPLVKGGA